MHSVSPSSSVSLTEFEEAQEDAAAERDFLAEILASKEAIMGTPSRPINCERHETLVEASASACVKAAAVAAALFFMLRK